MGPEVGIAATTRQWGDQLHRFLLDHGGAVIRGRIMSSEQAIESEFDLLLIDDICSFLTARLIVDLRRNGKGVMGVFAPEDGPDAKRRLLEVGVGDVIESDASPAEFLDRIRAVSVHGQRKPVDVRTPDQRGFCIAITGAPGGVGVTEIAVGIAGELPRESVALVDLDQAWPSVAQRLGLPVHPNLRTAIDFVLHEPERLAGAFHAATGFDVVTGLANPEAGGLPSTDLAALIGELAVMYRRVVVDVGSTGSVAADLVLKRVNAILVVGLADPVGLTRLIRAFRRIDEIPGERDVGVVVNRVRSSSERADAVFQLRRSLGAVPIFAIPDDSRVGRAARDGVLLGRGPYSRSVSRLAGLFSEVGLR